MKTTKIKEQKGFAASDALIAVLIIALFSGLIAAISYNIYLSNASLKRMSKANSYIVDMFEYIDKTYYDDVTQENLANYFNNKYYYQQDGTTLKSNSEVKLKTSAEENVNTPFKAEVTIVKYNEIEGNTDKFDLVKEITMKVSYKLGNKDQVIEMKKVKQREILETPNRPNLSMINLQEGEKLYPIKNINNEWKVCDQRDNTWYNYENGNWAIVFKTTKDLEIGEQIDVNNLAENETIYAWIPRYAYDSTNNKITFLYSNSNKFVQVIEGSSTLEQMDENLYTVSQDFSSAGKAVEGIWTNDTSVDAYTILDSIYPLNQ